MKTMRHLAMALLLAAAALTGSSAQASCLTSVEAAINWGNGKAYFFGYTPQGETLHYVRYDIKTDKADPGYPKAVNNSTWPGLNLDAVTAAVNWGNGKAYFLGYVDGYDGLAYVRYDIKGNKADPGYPKAVDDSTWPGLSVLPEITAALDIGDGNVYFFGYNQAYTYNQLGVTYNKSGNQVVGEPEEVSYENMGGNLLTNVSGAIDWGNKFYLFGWIEGDMYPAYERFTTSSGTMDAGYPRVLDAKMWPGLGCAY